jgi:glycosyltransferase involved in cell wall biosynthesis
MKVVFFANRMPDMCGAFLHDIDLGTELQNRGHQVSFLIIQKPKEGYNGGVYRGFRFLHYTAASQILDTSDVWICPHSPILPDVRKINSRGYYRPIIATCHFDGNYTAITGNHNSGWPEMLVFINRVMEANYRKNIVPWPPAVVRTEIVRPLMHRNQIEITEPFKGDFITLVNANQNKGCAQFLELARRMPDRKFLGILPYYGELRVPEAPANVVWTGFDDDIRNILKRTHILIMPSYYESFGRIAVEAMLNGIPVIYSKPNPNSRYSGGSTEGVQEWIGDVGIAADRDKPEEWMRAIEELDDEAKYTDLSQRCKDHIESMHIFTEGSRIAGLVESFSREHPVSIRSSSSQPASQPGQVRSSVPVQPTANFSLAGGRLKIRR